MSRKVKTVATGPLFNGTAAGAIAKTIDDFEREFANFTRDEIGLELKKVLRHPTGYYQKHIATTMVRSSWQVTDSGVIYGPWLEGTGSRNRKTRFKGYATFRRVTQRIDRQAVPFAERLLERRRGEMT